MLSWLPTTVFEGFSKYSCNGGCCLLLFVMIALILPVVLVKSNPCELMLYWWCVLPPLLLVCGHTPYGTTDEVSRNKKVRLSCFYNFLIWFSRSIHRASLNTGSKGTCLGGFPKLLYYSISKRTAARRPGASKGRLFLLQLQCFAFCVLWFLSVFPTPHGVHTYSRMI